LAANRDFEETFVHLLILLAIAFGLLVVQTTVAQILPWSHFVPHLSLVVVIHLGLRQPLGQGAALAFAIGYLVDTFAGASIGLHTFTAVATFVVSRLVFHQLFLQGRLFEIFLAFSMACFDGVLALLIRAVFDQALDGLLMDVKLVLFRAVTTAMCAPMVFGLVSRLEPEGTRRAGGVERKRRR
jgi:rod shape-determining protein MreD